MKKMIASMILWMMFSISSFAQPFTQPFTITTYNGWFIENKRAVWQKVYTVSIASPEEIIAHLKKFSWVRNVEERNSTIYATAVDYRMDFRKYENSLDIPIQFKASTWNWAVAIDVKPGKYRVTISSLTFTPDPEPVFQPCVKYPVNQLYDDEVLVKKRTAFRETALKNLASFARDLDSLYNLAEWRTPASRSW